MYKTKLGISVGLMAAIVFFAGMFESSFILLALAAYVLIREENEWLRKSAVKAVVFSFMISIIYAIINIIPDLFTLITDAIRVFDFFDFVNDIIAFINDINLFVGKILTVVKDVISLVVKLIWLSLAIKAVNQTSVKVPVADDIVNKNM